MCTMKKFTSDLFQVYPVLDVPVTGVSSDYTDKFSRWSSDNYFRVSFINRQDYYPQIDIIQNRIRGNMNAYNREHNIICGESILIYGYSYVSVCKHSKIIHLDGVNYCYNYLFNYCNYNKVVRKILIKLLKSLNVKYYGICENYELMNIFNNIIPNVDSNIIHGFTKYQLKLKCDSLGIQFKSKFTMNNLRLKINNKLEKNHRKVLLKQLSDALVFLPVDVISVITSFLPIDVTRQERLHIVRVSDFPDLHLKKDCFDWLDLLKVKYNKSWSKQKLLDLIKLYKFKYF